MRKPKLKLSIVIEGNDDGDLECALEEISRLVGEGYTTGQNANETGSYSFSISA